jgi:hypothetical protein
MQLVVLLLATIFKAQKQHQPVALEEAYRIIICLLFMPLIYGVELADFAQVKPLIL